MKKFAMAGLAVIFAMVAMASAAMAYDIDLMMNDLQPDVGIYELTLMPDGADQLMGADVLAEVDVAPVGLTGTAIMTVQASSLTEPMVTRGSASSTMVDDAIRVWRARTVDAFTISPDLLI